MISQDVVSKIYSSVCALGIRRVDAEQHQNEPIAPHFEIIGTGFAIGSGLVITNRHVLQSMRQHMESNDYDHESLSAQFVTLKPNGWSLHFCAIGSVGLCNDPDEDIGLLYLPGLGTLGNRSVSFGNPGKLLLGQSLAILGYADGKILHQPNFGDVFDEELYRFGPILQQGYLSAVAPIHGCNVVTRLLLDIRTTSGLSGSPVFNPDNGEVIGIHFASNKTTTAFAVPLDAERVQSYVSNFDTSLRDWSAAT